MNDSTWCYVDNGDGIERRPVELGRNNDKFVEILDGLESADRAVLNPMTLANMETSTSKEIVPTQPEETEAPVVEEPATIAADAGSDGLPSSS
jgi:hypothetical protein